ncbi:MAG: cytochrome c oxidase assembly protein [Actinobacteria bacterium]|nr:cytochrome c oxidase assembly protein [Actinomycetota bacterium]
MRLDLTWDLSLQWSTITSITLPILIGVAYFSRVGRLRERHRQPRLWRQASFTVGLAAIVLVTVGPIDDLADNLVFGHMVQHILLLEEISLLLALGLTGPILGPILTKPGFRQLRGLTHPVAAFAIWAVVMFGWHAPPAYQLAAENEVVHLFEHASFVAAGVLMWLAMLGPFPKPEWFGNGAKAVYVAAIHFTSMVLANVLMWSGTVIYPLYLASDRAHRISPITDQSLAGVVLMAQSALLMFGMLAWLLLRWAQQDTERQELIDLAYEHGIELDERRARRAVAAGRTAELRNRLLSSSTGRTPKPS